MQFQACKYKETCADERRLGIAKVTAGFNGYNVEFIVDCETGRKLPDVWDYTLIETPLSHIDTEYMDR